MKRAPLAIIIGALIVSVAIYASSLYRSPTPERIRPVSTTDHLLGNPAAPVVIIEYTDFALEASRTFTETLRHVVATKGAQGTVAWVVRHFPSADTPASLLAARAAECAGQVGGTSAFFAMSEALSQGEPIDSSAYGALAASLHLPGDTFATCYADAAHTLDKHLLAEASEARRLGATLAPYTLIVKPDRAPIILDGPYTFDEVTALVD